ncbi:PREDICTED: prorelaxin-like [Condylura cristata]|uniref:prorelaxin-like n=1 Tax=Condylura cristata TaxID=143302 RepID=UPI0003342F2D|nr:PREDICTED: prorelaxin-like [Condylura cristata]
MQPQFLYHLLGIWLLLIQLPRGIPAYRDETVRVCGRELMRIVLDICGRPKGQTELGRRLGIPFGHLPDAQTVNRMLVSKASLQEELISTKSESQPSLRKLQPALQEANLNSEEFKRNHPTRPNVAEDNENDSLSELNNWVFDKHSRKKRDVHIGLSSKCCKQGCSRQEIARFC